MREEKLMELVLWTLVIFVARVVDVGMGTIRVQFIVRRKKLPAALIGFVEVLIFILIVSRVIQDIQHWPYVLAYAGGFATGTILGMSLTEKLSQRVMQTTVICHKPSEEVETAVREAGFALTRYEGEGRDGPVDVLDVVCTSKQLAQLTAVIKGVNAHAFVYAQELAGLQGGVVYGLKAKTQ
jgi:uncharacterized protein YebE (UPF0316 family)